MTKYDEDLMDGPIADYVRYLRDELDDPKSGNRNNDDPFVFWNTVSLQIGHDKHKVPFVLVKPADTTSEPVGNWANGYGSDDTLVFRVKVVSGSLGNAKSILSDAINKTKKAHGAFGTDDINNQSYDLSELTPEQVTNGNERTQYREDDYNEFVFEVSFQTYTGFN